LNKPVTDDDTIYVDPLKYGAPLNERDTAVKEADTDVAAIVFAGTLVEMVVNGA
jgi:hypothetical protein